MRDFLTAVALVSFLTPALLKDVEAAEAERHCGVAMGQASSVVKMWDVQPASARKTAREMVVATALAHERFRICKENHLTVFVKIEPSQRTVFYIKD